MANEDGTAEALDPVDEVPANYQTALTARGFELTSVVGRGASGRVFLGRQGSLKRDVAVKFFDNEMSAANPQVRERFVREAELLARVASPHVPYVIVAGTLERDGKGTPYYVMQYLPGQPLDQLLKKRRLSPDVAAGYMKQIADALAVAHQHKVIHRDVKPANVLCNADHLYLIDFSIGASIYEMLGPARLTKMAQRLGTPEYASPEQRTNAASAREPTDIWSCGIVLFEMLTGHPGFRRESFERELAGAPAELIKIIGAACMDDPAVRPTAVELSTALAALSPHRLRLRSSPAYAMCLNPLCRRTEWSRQYDGPNYIGTKNCTVNHCEYCGKLMTYECPKCATPISGKPFCGVCGQEVYSDPQCEVCSVVLEREEVPAGKCQHCAPTGAVTQLPAQRLALNASESESYIPSEPGDDDIPF